jgi:hypothetical protein
MPRRLDPAQKRAILLLLPIAVGGIAASFLPHGLVSTCVLFLITAVLVAYLFRLGRLRLFQPSSWPPAIPLSSSRNLWTVAKAVLCFLASAAWAGMATLAVKHHLIPETLPALSLALLLPCGLLISLGGYLLLRTAFNPNRA